MDILLLIIFFVFIIIVSINSIVEFIIELSHRIKENARAKYIKSHFPEAYDEYFSGNWKDRINRREDSFSEIFNWSNQQWEDENSKLIVKKNRRIRWENDIKWEDEQYDFATKCVEIAKKEMPDFGRYCYSPKVSVITEDGLSTSLDMRVWQFFPMSLCLDEQLDYTNIQYAKNNLNNLQEFKDKKRWFNKSVYDNIIAFIKELSKEDDVLICMNKYIKGWDGHALQFHYKNIIDAIDASHVITLATNSYVGFEVKEWGKRLKRKLIIIDMMTENDSLEWKCAQIFEILREKHPLICYISLLKCFSREEMISLINKKNEEIEKRAVVEKEIDEWKSNHAVFTNHCRNLRNDILKSFGCIHYSIDIVINDIRTPKDYKVWQFFSYGFCNEEVDYTYIPQIKKNAEKISKGQFLLIPDSVVEKIAEYINKLNSEEETAVYFCPPINGQHKESYLYNYEKIIVKLDDSINNKLVYDPTYDKEIGDESDVKDWVKLIKRRIVIVDLITENDRLKDICREVIDVTGDIHPLISFISIYKGYGIGEILKKIEIQKSLKRGIEERAILKDEAPTIFRNNIKKWERLTNDFFYTWLFYYYPTTCEFEASKEEWANRYTVWDFKNDPDRDISLIDHVNALDKVIPQIKKKLTDTFGEKYLQFISLVCIPASTKERNELRYDTFSRRLCKLTGMENAFKHITITEDGMSKNDKKNTTGHSKQPKIRIDDWFKGKYVLLFDDVITEGNTMLRYKRLLEDAGATVIGGLTLGKTKHERIP